MFLICNANERWSELNATLATADLLLRYIMLRYSGACSRLTCGFLKRNSAVKVYNIALEAVGYCSISRTGFVIHTPSTRRKTETFPL